MCLGAGKLACCEYTYLSPVQLQRETHTLPEKGHMCLIQTDSLLTKVKHHACRGEAASKGVHEEMGLILADLTPIVNMAFFSLAGASLILVSFPLKSMMLLTNAAPNESFAWQRILRAADCLAMQLTWVAVHVLAELYEPVPDIKHVTTAHTAVMGMPSQLSLNYLLKEGIVCREE